MPMSVDPQVRKPFLKSKHFDVEVEKKRELPPGTAHGRTCHGGFERCDIRTEKDLRRSRMEPNRLIDSRIHRCVHVWNFPPCEEHLDPQTVAKLLFIFHFLARLVFERKRQKSKWSGRDVSEHGGSSSSLPGCLCAQRFRTANSRHCGVYAGSKIERSLTRCRKSSSASSESLR